MTYCLNILDYSKSVEIHIEKIDVQFALLCRMQTNHNTIG